MTGAESLLQTLAMSGAELCFMNPGTSEMHFVAALDEDLVLADAPRRAQMRRSWKRGWLALSANWSI